MISLYFSKQRYIKKEPFVGSSVEGLWFDSISHNSRIFYITDFSWKALFSTANWHMVEQSRLRRIEASETYSTKRTKQVFAGKKYVKLSS